MCTLKIIVAAIAIVLLCLGSITETIAALWGRQRSKRGRQACNVWDESIEDV